MTDSTDVRLLRDWMREMAREHRTAADSRRDEAHTWREMTDESARAGRRLVQQMSGRPAPPVPTAQERADLADTALRIAERETEEAGRYDSAADALESLQAENVALSARVAALEADKERVGALVRKVVDRFVGEIDPLPDDGKCPECGVSSDRLKCFLELPAGSCPRHEVRNINRARERRRAEVQSFLDAARRGEGET